MRKDIFIIVLVCAVAILIASLLTKNSYIRDSFSKFVTSVDVKDHETLTNKYIKSLPEVPESNKIPPLLHVTYKDLTKIPPKVYANIQTYAPEYSLQLYDDDDVIKFLKTYFHPSVVNAFKQTRAGAHKADLFRYCVLYVYGGVYMDVKTVLLQPLKDVFKHPSVTLYLVLDQFQTHAFHRIYNGLIATVPRNPFFLQLIHNFVTTKISWYYHIYLRQFYLILKNELIEPLQVGKVIRTHNNVVYLFQQNCDEDQVCPDGPDRYGLCCYIYDEAQEKPRQVFKVRYSDFPWN
jgi:mannosyltransferase OCH1-like enzyme